MLRSFGHLVQRCAQHRPTTLEVVEIDCSGLNGLCIIYCAVYLLSNQFTSEAEITRSLDLRDIFLVKLRLKESKRGFTMFLPRLTMFYIILSAGYPRTPSHLR